MLDDDGKKITIEESGSKNSIELSDDGITLTRQAGRHHAVRELGQGQDRRSGIEAKSTGPAKLESSATVDLKASATLGLRGALVKIN